MIFKPSKNPEVIELTKSIKDRSINLDRLRPLQLEELNEKGKSKRFCAWCYETELFRGNQKYCSNACSTSAMAWAYPQKEDSLRFLLYRQDFKCAHCQYDYRIIMEEIIAKDCKKYGAVEPEFSKLPWHYFKRLKNNCSKDRKPEVDHVLAISKGGNSLGLDNHQVLCYTCHKQKTKSDLSKNKV